MDIIWDDKKNQRLRTTRGIGFEDVGAIILDQRYLAVLENPSHPDEMIFLIRFKDYTYVVPFVIDANENIVLKTIFPSRKFHRLYGETKNESKA